MTRPLPIPVTGAEVYLAAIHDRLGELLDRLDRGQAPPPGNPPAADPQPESGVERKPAPGKRTQRRNTRGA
jgi:hypothetical protein